ncbi:MAG: DUF2339 domain-containing protein [Kiritimatiellia bacterium]
MASTPARAALSGIQSLRGKRHDGSTLRSGGLSVFWGVFALGMVWGGLVKRVRALRWTGLLLFAGVALKVFLHDLASLEPLWKIMAFLLLGVVLLSAAFVYVRFQDRFPLVKSLFSLKVFFCFPSLHLTF